MLLDRMRAVGRVCADIAYISSRYTNYIFQEVKNGCPRVLISKQGDAKTRTIFPQYFVHEFTQFYSSANI